MQAKLLLYVPDGQLAIHLDADRYFKSSKPERQVRQISGWLVAHVLHGVLHLY